MSKIPVGPYVLQFVAANVFCYALYDLVGTPALFILGTMLWLLATGWQSRWDHVIGKDQRRAASREWLYLLHQMSLSDSTDDAAHALRVYANTRGLIIPPEDIDFDGWRTWVDQYIARKGHEE